ncbi:uncharacterized protein LOC133730206 [Rosa rugosa]|uniref:uncharacterized protein LOC133730206 n=1 Tax=Rosa rugosa TaxID=74645 RepID=UPI002B404917|nr:uncharacterized protein LOC133730206 [Rosa rugosa]
MEKEWLQFDRFKDEYRVGARMFVDKARADYGNSEDEIICPCIKCRNSEHHHFEIVYEHLVTRGMDPTYKIWICHGETGSESNHEDLEIPETYKLFKDLCFQHDEDDEDVDDTIETREAEILNLVREAETPLIFGCTNYTKMSASVALLKMKARHYLTDIAFDDILRTSRSFLPEDNTLPESLYSMKKLVKAFDLGYEKIHACVNDCCLFRKDLQHLENCPKCGASRWKLNESSSKIQKGIPAKVLRYFPIIPRLRRMFAITETAEQLRWHSNNKSQDGKMRHPVDVLAWETINRRWPSFASDPRNIRFGLATDGFNPFHDLRSTYSCWPVILTIYNLPPWLCMSKESLMLTLLIPGPKQPGNDINVYLAPLVDDLKKLWNQGVEVYDAFSQVTFNLRAILMWTVNDFPAYGNLSGWPYKGKVACPVCREETCAEWLTNSRKFSYMGHRRFLPSDHPLREEPSMFNGHPEHGSRPKISKGEQIFEETSISNV